MNAQAPEPSWPSLLFRRERLRSRLLGGGRSIPIGRVLGIPIGATPSWFVVTALLILLIAEPMALRLNVSTAGSYLAAAVLMTLVTVSILLHELGHALMARRLGIGVSGIDLWFFGGVARTTRVWDSPAGEAKVIAAGPAATLAIVLVSGALTAILGGGLSADLLLVGAQSGSSDALAMFSLLVPLNAMLLAFNLVPAYPLDGGQLVHALIWKLTGNLLRATRIAGRGGQVFAALLICLGLFLVARGAPFGGVSLVLLGWMLGQAARAAVRGSGNVAARVEGKTVADIVDEGPVELALPAATTAIRAHDDFFQPYGWTYFPVVDRWGRLLGVVTRERIDHEIAAGSSAVQVSELVEAGDVSRWCVRPDRPLHAVVFDGHLQAHGSLLAVDDRGVLLGVVTTAQLRLLLDAPPPQPVA